MGGFPGGAPVIRAAPPVTHSPSVPFGSAPAFRGVQGGVVHSPFGSGVPLTGIVNPGRPTVSPVQSNPYNPTRGSLPSGGFGYANHNHSPGYGYGIWSLGGLGIGYGSGLRVGLGWGTPFGVGLSLNSLYTGGYYPGGGSANWNRAWMYGGSYQPNVALSYPMLAMAQPVLPSAFDPTMQPQSQPQPVVSEYAQRAEQFSQAGRWEEAANAFRHAAVDDPTNGPLALRGAQALLAAGRYGEAAGAAQQGLALLSSDKWLAAAKDSASVFGSSDVADRVYADLRQTADAANAQAGYRFLAGWQAAGRGDYKTAAADLKAVTAAFPDDGVARQLLAVVEKEVK